MQKKTKNTKTLYNYNVLQNIVLQGNDWKTYRLWILSPVGIWPYHLIHITGNVLPCQATGEISPCMLYPALYGPHLNVA